MPIICSADPPPTPTNDIKLINNNGARDPTKAQPLTTPMDFKPDSEANRCCKIPIVRLDTDVITDMMAARLATSLLGHILFLKNQVPL
jgi:hypothetical protein